MLARRKRNNVISPEQARALFIKLCESGAVIYCQREGFVINQNWNPILLKTLWPIYFGFEQEVKADRHPPAARAAIAYEPDQDQDQDQEVFSSEQEREDALNILRSIGQKNPDEFVREAAALSAAAFLTLIQTGDPQVVLLALILILAVYAYSKKNEISLAVAGFFSGSEQKEHKRDGDNNDFSDFVHRSP